MLIKNVSLLLTIFIAVVSSNSVTPATLSETGENGNGGLDAKLNREMRRIGGMDFGREGGMGMGGGRMGMGGGGMWMGGGRMGMDGGRMGMGGGRMGMGGMGMGGGGFRMGGGGPGWNFR